MPTRPTRRSCGARGSRAPWRWWRWSGSGLVPVRTDLAMTTDNAQCTGRSSVCDRDLESCRARIGGQPGGGVRAGNAGLSGLGAADGDSALASGSFPRHPDRAWKGRVHALIDDLCGSPWLGEVGAVLSGYLGEAGRRIRCGATGGCGARCQSGSALYVRSGNRRCRRALCPRGAGRGDPPSDLIPVANIATPNIHELGWLSERELADSASMVSAAETLGPRVFW
jgi:hypothetical protein